MFNIAVKIDGIESRRRNAGILHVILGFFLVLKAFDYYSYIQYSSFIPILPFLAVAALSLYYGFFRRRIDDSAKYNFWLRLLQTITFTAFAIIMVRVGHQPLDYYGLFLWAFLCIILLVSERKIFNDTVIYITNEGIKVPGNYRDHLLSWKDLSDVVIRHDFITIFHHNKKYLQFQVMQTLSELELAKMNAFCREEIERIGSLKERDKES